MRITLEKLTKTFAGGVTAVRDMSLEIGDGELLVVLGPSGCGKTTTLRLIAGLERPSSGEVHFGGSRMTTTRPAKRNVGFVFQQPVLYPHMTVERNLAFVLRRKRLTSAERARRIADVARLCRIDHVLRRKPGQTSVGEQQRVSLARAVLRRPTCLLMDEPLASLDAPLRANLRREIRGVHEAHRLTSVFVTHDQKEAFALADRVALMNGGELVQVATPMDMYERPANVYAATFIGSPGMNLVDGTIEARDGRQVFRAGERRVVALPSGMKLTNGRAVTLGIRPEHITIQPQPEPEGGIAFDVDVNRIEPLGDHIIVHARTSGDALPLTIKSSPAAPIMPGDTVRAAVQLGALHFFEPGPDGRRLGRA